VVGSFPIPRYVLKAGAIPTGPLVEPESSDGRIAFVVYGFSDKPQYDAFHNQSSRLLTPYPLVKRYLQNQIALLAGQLGLIVLEATSPSQSQLHAVALDRLVEALESNQSIIQPTHQLLLVGNPSTYRVTPIPTPTAEQVTR
jgi:hypothetical protein